MGGIKIGDMWAGLVLIAALTVLLSKRNKGSEVIDSFSKGLSGVFATVEGATPSGFTAPS